MELQGLQRVCHRGPCLHHFAACRAGWGARGGAFQLAKYSYGSLLLFQGSTAVPDPALARCMELSLSVENFPVDGEGNSKQLL